MKKFFVICMLMMLSLTCYASTASLSSSSVQSAGFEKLSDSEKAEIIKAVADKAATKQLFGRDSEETIDKAERWVKIGSNIGLGLAGAAKEVGVAVNEFAGTPVGKMTTLLIVWHMIGGQLIHVFGGILIWAVGFYCLRHILKRAYPPHITYSTTEKNIFGNFVVVRTEPIPMRDDNACGWLFAHLIVLGAGLAVILTF